MEYKVQEHNKISKKKWDCFVSSCNEAWLLHLYSYQLAIQSLTKETYGILGMKGIVSMDFIIRKEGKPFLIEINSNSGMSKESIVPKMLSKMSMDLKNILF